MPQKFSSNGKFALSKSLKVGILSGGSSSERRISLRSGRAVSHALTRAGFSPLKIDPAEVALMERKLSRIDVAFLALHGTGGEDGQIQRYLEKKRIPYIGSNPQGSLNAFDKSVSKKCFAKEGIPTPLSIEIRLSNWKRRLSKFPPPFFIKPPRDGSSVGIFLVEDLAESAEKIRQALSQYDKLLAEKKIFGREFTVGILGEKPLPVIELIPKRSFYDYRAKYTRGMTEYLVPAPISKALSRRLQALALKVHEALQLRDFSRVDIMLDSQGKPYVLEANSIPGLTDLSLLPKAARAAGISFESLCYRLVEWAHQRNGFKKVVRNGKEKA